MYRHLFPAALLTLGLPALAHDYTLGDLTVNHPYSFETARTSDTGAGYLSLTNAGDAADTLIDVEIEGLTTQLHKTETDANGVARMLHQKDGIGVPAGETVTLEPGGFHIMLYGLTGAPLEIGDKIDATLVFESAGRMNVTFNVEERGEHTPKADHSGH